MKQDPKQFLQGVQAFLDDKIKEAKEKKNLEERENLMSNIGEDLVQAFVPILEAIYQTTQFSKEEIKEILAQIVVQAPNVNVPDVNIPEIKLPTINVPKQDAPIIPPIKIPEIKIPEIKIPKIVVPKPEVTVNVPPIKIPKADAPIVNIPDKMKIDWDKVNKSNPLPVILTDKKGEFYEAIANAVASGGNLGGLRGAIEAGISVLQKAVESAGNSSTTNLAASATFTGVSATTLGVNAIQVSLKTDQDCTVYIDQSPDGTNWDITDTFNYIASINNFGTTVQAIGSYFRVRVTNIGAATTTYFRLQSVLCPIADPLPRALDENGHLLAAIHVMKDEYGFEVENTPNGEMRTVIPTILVGSTFEGTTLDPNFWTATLANGGTAAVANDQVTVATNTTANGSSKLNSVRRARYVPGQSHVERLQLQLNNIGVTNNTRKWGVGWGATMPTITDGAYFQLSGTTFSVVTLKGGAATTVASGNFNGVFGNSYTLDTNLHTWEIYWNNRYVFFTIDGKVLHTIAGSTSTWADTVQHHIYMDSVNAGGITSNNTIVCRAAGIRRLGALSSQPTSKYQAGTTAGVVCKYGTGNLHGVVISGIVNNAVVTIYDNTAASGTVLWSSGAMTNQTVPFQVDFLKLPFFTGLTFDITAANCNLLVIYE